MSLREEIATPEGKSRYVRRLFATIADRYDFITGFLSYGQDRRWKRRLVDLAAPRRSARALDLAAGTGDIAWEVERRGADVVALDITFRMIELARRKAAGRRVHLLVGDMTRLPFPDESFDLVTTGYGLRNVPDLALAIDELFRVVRPGGQVLSLDFNRPENPLLRVAYLGYLTLVGGALGSLLHGDADTYRYIPESLRRYPGGVAVAQMLRARGFARVAHIPVLGGLMSIHQAHKGE
jgi:demethylmenaquinone methyltransferase/2-methoxy-6-polyprenyl-1,4-benzoquinol methylase